MYGYQIPRKSAIFSLQGVTPYMECFLFVFLFLVYWNASLHTAVILLSDLEFLENHENLYWTSSTNCLLLCNTVMPLEYYYSLLVLLYITERMCVCVCNVFMFLPECPSSGVPWMQKIRSTIFQLYLSMVTSSTLGAGQNMALYALPSARKFCCSDSCHPGAFHFIFSPVIIRKKGVKTDFSINIFNCGSVEEQQGSFMIRENVLNCIWVLSMAGFGNRFVNFLWNGFFLGGGAGGCDVQQQE